MDITQEINPALLSNLDTLLYEWEDRHFIPTNGNLLVELMTHWDDLLKFSEEKFGESEYMDTEIFKRFQSLIKDGVNPNYIPPADIIRPIDGFTPINYNILSSESKYKKEVLKILLEAGADPDKGHYGWTALMGLVYNGDLKLISFLLRSTRCDMTRENDFGVDVFKLLENNPMSHPPTLINNIRNLLEHIR